MTILVTGGAGFIGSNFLHYLISNTDDEIICIDKLTYAGNKNNIPKNVKTYITDIADKYSCEFIFNKYKPKKIFHLAAETHVDNSIKDCSQFVHTNINGTLNLLNLSVKYEIEKFMHISTDEVYGSIETGSFTETSNYSPRNPYSASKSSSDHFVMAYHTTYGLPTIITNCSNNYGPRQNSEKLIAKTITNLIKGKKVPIYGKGNQIRDWLYVEDHCEALLTVSRRGKVGQKYNIGGKCEIENIKLIRMIFDRMNVSENMIEYVEDRPGHDYRYSTDISKINNELNWFPKYSIEQGLDKTIEWYESNTN